MSNSYKDLDYYELIETLAYACEYCGDVESQYNSEVSLYGDGWVGSSLEVTRLKAEVRAIEDELKSRPEYAEFIARRASGVDDIPF